MEVCRAVIDRGIPAAGATERAAVEHRPSRWPVVVAAPDWCRPGRPVGWTTVIDTVAPQAPPRRGWPVHLGVAAASVLVGGAVAFGVLLLAGWRPVPVHRYEINLMLAVEATTAQRDAARAVLERIPGNQGVTVVTREQALERVRKMMADEGKTMPDGVKAEALPEKLEVFATGRDFDCSTVSALHGYTGVKSVQVGRTHGGNGSLALLDCS